jgi:hypothetical protein
MHLLVSHDGYKDGCCASAGVFARNKCVLYFTEVGSDQFLTRRSRAWGGSWTRMKFLS